MLVIPVQSHVVHRQLGNTTNGRDGTADRCRRPMRETDKLKEEQP